MQASRKFITKAEALIRSNEELQAWKNQAGAEERKSMNNRKSGVLEKLHIGRKTDLKPESSQLRKILDRTIERWKRLWQYFEEMTLICRHEVIFCSLCFTLLPGKEQRDSSAYGDNINAI